MKKLILLLLFIPLVSFGQTYDNTVVKVDNYTNTSTMLSLSYIKHDF